MKQLQSWHNSKGSLRNLLVRTLSGVCFVLIMLVGLLWHPLAYTMLVIFITGVMTLEFYKVSLGPALKLWRRLCWASLLFLCVSVCYTLRGGSLPIWVWGLYLLPAVLTLFLPRPPAARLWLVIPYVYFGLPIASWSWLVFADSGNFCGIALLVLFLCVWASDVGAYLIGMAFGQRGGHKLCPRISPKKSWEGVYGGLVFTVLTGFILRAAGLFPEAWYHTLGLSLVLSLASVAGDLLESMWKRHFGVKDSGGIMPGHGGLMDRFDGALVALPLAILYMKFFGLMVA